MNGRTRSRERNASRRSSRTGLPLHAVESLAAARAWPSTRIICKQADQMTRIYLPTTGPDDWRWLLASPGLHWQQGTSAKALADAWEDANDWPEAVATALAGAEALSGLDLLVALPEHEVPLPGGSRPSQTDLFVVARRPHGALVVIAVEGKAEEPFGDHTVEEWRRLGGAGREKRLAYLLDVLGLRDDDAVAGIRYQLLHRTASAVIEAGRFGAEDAVMLVHSFSATRSWFADFAAFAGLYGDQAQSDCVARVADLDGVGLHLGWVSDSPLPLAAPATLGPRFQFLSRTSARALAMRAS